MWFLFPGDTTTSATGPLQTGKTRRVSSSRQWWLGANWSEWEDVAIFEHGDFGGGEEAQLNDGGLVEIEATVDVGAAEIAEESGLAHLTGTDVVEGRALALLTVVTAAPRGEERLATLPQHVGEVKLSVGALVVGEVVGEEEEHGKHGELAAILAHEEAGGLLDGLAVERLAGTGDGEKADDVVDHDGDGQALTVELVDHGEVDGGEHHALLRVGSSFGPLGG